LYLAGAWIVWRFVLQREEHPRIEFGVELTRQGNLSIAGIPLDEPVAFVMNTPGEIRQAMIDYQTRQFGEIG
jgi:redox-sensitive bicupin YhaK (pirin superfamily)